MASCAAGQMWPAALSALAGVRRPIDAEELARAKQQVRSRIQLQLEDSRAVSAWYGSRLALDLPLREPDEAIACFEQVGIEDVERVAQRVIDDERLRLAVIGPIADPSALEAVLRIDG